ncbi:MAG: exodeoxyribonuclease VII large subunit [Oscillospiraceae bacterium]
MNRESICVSALNRYVKALLETDEVLSQVWIEGEISGLVAHKASGHMYFFLKDELASVKAVMFRADVSKLRYIPKDGMRVVAKCRVSLYERDGAFQLYVSELLATGIGASHEQLEALKAKLSAEGLFDFDRKRILPEFPQKIAVVTSASGAALHDIIKVVSRRNPTVKLVNYSVNVQGALAAGTIINAISKINFNSTVDLVIIARGGGSKEDLSVFNDEGVVRAASSLRVPYISAVGHETDFTLLDFAADLRAPTPSAAAELAVKDVNEDMRRIESLFSSVKYFVFRSIESSKKDIDELAFEMTARAKGIFEKDTKCISDLAKIIESFNPAKIFDKGYAVVLKENRTVISADEIMIGDSVDVSMKNGVLRCTVDAVERENHGNKL